MSRRKAKKHGCSFGTALAVILIFILLTAILISTGVLTSFVNSVEKQFYPLKYSAEISKASEEYDLEPEYICAVIYTESSFDPNAQSHAGAKGLMQLMPETFLWLAETRGEDLNTDDLWDAETNIDYGCYYLRYLINHYGDKYTACAAYNAGNVVSHWLSDERYSSDGITLSYIPYGETADYVDKIRSAEEMYEKLYFEEE
ncbi:MAG: lytic transglycosylase domain-containing protein [Ruminococcus sp.]